MGMENLLELDGVNIEIEEGYWVKFEAKQVARTEKVPHGIKYCLTLHRPGNQRILGFDNAHEVKPEGNPYKYAGRIFTYDHEHKYLKGAVPYEFVSPEQLISDFWIAVDDALEQEVKK